MAWSREAESLSKIMVNYELLAKRVDQDFLEMRLKFNSRIHCKKGCSACCKPGLDVGPMEAAYIRFNIENDFELKRKLEELRMANPHQSRRCEFLSADETCAIYNIRPLICRAFGGPARYRSNDGRDSIGICELNEEGFDLANLKSDDILDMNRISQILAVLNIAYNQDANRVKRRFALSLQAIFALEESPRDASSSI